MHGPVHDSRLAPDVFLDVDLAASRQVVRADVRSQHPERRPDPLPIRHLNPRFDLAVGEPREPLRLQPRRRVLRARIRDRLNHQAPLAIDEHVVRRVGVILQLLVAPAVLPAAEVVGPLRAIRRTSRRPVELIAPNQPPGAKRGGFLLRGQRRGDKQPYRGDTCYRHMYIMGTISRSLREALRTLLRKPGVTALAVSSLALAIGFSTAAFSILDAYALRELPVRDPARLLSISALTREHRADSMTWPEYLALTAAARSLEGFTAENRRGPRVRLPDRDDFPITSGVSANFFDLLGVEASLGHVFKPGRDDRDTVVLSHRYWRDTLKSDPAIIGRTLLVGRGSLRVTGVLPPDFAGTERGLSVDLFVPMETWFRPMQMASAGDTRRTDYLLLGRLRPGVTPAQARAECDAVLRQMEQDGSAPAAGRIAQIGGFTDENLAAKLKSNAVIFGVIVLLVLIAAANLANLRLLDNESRRRETGIRLALGAGRAALARLHLVETLLLSGTGTALGIGVAAWLVNLAPTLFYAGARARDYHIRLDARSLAFSSAALVGVALIGALIPLADAWRLRILPVMQTTRVTRSEERRGGKGCSS